MKVKISPSVLKGTITAPPSKSMAHRFLICAGLSKGESIIDNVAYSEDILATLDCLSALGAHIKKEESKVTIKGTEPYLKTESEFNCRESGSTLRFFVPILMLGEKLQTLKGYGRLMERPMDIYEKIAESKGLFYGHDGKSLKIKGSLKGGKFTVKGNISSQFISGLLFALPLLKEDSEIELVKPIESVDYINMTIDAMKQFGIAIIWNNDTTLYIKGNQEYKSKNLTVEGDWSNSAFLESFNLFSSDIKAENLNENSLQGDKIYREYFKKLSDGAPILSVKNCPDLAPILMTVAAMKNGATLKDTKRLKIKESDRAEAMRVELKKFGANITVLENEVKIEKALLHSPNEILSSHNDHRIAMSLALISSIYGGIIDGAESVKKSYPDFFLQTKKLGLEVEADDN